jgi:ribosomal protein L11 methyltransferase
VNDLHKRKIFDESMIYAPRGNAATMVARLQTDEQSASKIVAMFAECFADAHRAISSVDSGKGYWTIAIHFPASVEQKAVRALTEAAAGPAAAKALRFERLAAKDWVRESLVGLRPVQAGRFIVHGAHDRARVAVNRIGIEIEASLAFGTGHHGTTRGCLLALDRLCKPLRTHRKLRILDLGTGSGVLAIAAARALRQRVLATDIDAEAGRIARANARLNGVGTLVEVVHADAVVGQRVRARPPFDVVFANILLGPLQRFAAPLTKLTAPGARVVLSGLLSSQANAALSAYRGLALERRIGLDGWTTLVLARRQRPRSAVARRRPHS